MTTGEGTNTGGVNGSAVGAGTGGLTDLNTLGASTGGINEGNNAPRLPRLICDTGGEFGGRVRGAPVASLRLTDGCFFGRVAQILD